MQVSVIGVGYAGLVTAACLARWRNDAIGVDMIRPTRCRYALEKSTVPATTDGWVAGTFKTYGERARAHAHVG